MDFFATGGGKASLRLLAEIEALGWNAVRIDNFMLIKEDVKVGYVLEIISDINALNSQQLFCRDQDFGVAEHPLGHFRGNQNTVLR